MDKCTLNGGNCNGIFVTVAAPSGAIAGGKPTHDTDPPKQLTQQQKKAWYEKTWDAVKDAGTWTKNEASSATHEIGAALQHPIEGVTGFGKDLVNTVDGATPHIDQPEMAKIKVADRTEVRRGK